MRRTLHPEFVITEIDNTEPRTEKTKQNELFEEVYLTGKSRLNKSVKIIFLSLSNITNIYDS